VTIVPGVADGGGTGLSVRKRGWICDSEIDGLVALIVGVALRPEVVENAVGGLGIISNAGDRNLSWKC